MVLIKLDMSLKKQSCARKYAKWRTDQKGALFFAPQELPTSRYLMSNASSGRLIGNKMLVTSAAPILLKPRALRDTNIVVARKTVMPGTTPTEAKSFNTKRIMKTHQDGFG